MIETLAWIALALALAPVLVGAINLGLYRRPPRASVGTAALSVLIPARDEAANIGDALRSVLANRDLELEVVVLDDESRDDTAAIVGALAEEDPRVRLARAPALPPGWSGKQHACHVLAGLAKHGRLVFMDADVRLAPDALGRMGGFLDRGGAKLASGFPRELTGGLGEALVIPLIHFLLLGYLPVWAMRRGLSPGLGAGCGQLFIADREAYREAGGHAAIRASLHDGIKLPRAFRASGHMTDLFDATDLADCRMYSGLGEVWAGFSKNATEGMATPRALPLWTVLLFGGQVLPFLLLAAAGPLGWGSPVALLGGIAAGAALAFRLVMARRFRQSVPAALLHPLGILLVLAIQWTALVRARRGRPATWRGRSYGTP